MSAILRFIILPASIILGATWWVLLKHHRSTLLPFLAVIAALLLAIRLVGLSPLGFFVSFAGYLWFVVLAWVAASVVRGISSVIRTK